VRVLKRKQKKRESEVGREISSQIIRKRYNGWQDMQHAKAKQAIHTSSRNMKERCLWRNKGAEGYNIKMDTNKNIWIGLIRLRR
jgi:hypothetical protein